MSDTPKLADETKKLLDSGWAIVLFKSELGSYTALAVTGDSTCSSGLADALENVMEAYEGDEPVQNGVCLTDDFEPSQALYRLTEKVFGRIV